jgi:hypothetical protein
MASAKEMRASIDVKLDGWEQEALAIKRQLQSNREQALNKIEYQKRIMSAAAARLKQAIPRFTQISEQAMQEVNQKIDALQLQLALGQAETRDAYRAQKKEIQGGIADIEARVFHAATELEGNVEAAVKEWIYAGLVLNAELEAAQIHFDEVIAEDSADIDLMKMEIIDQVRAYRDLIAAIRKMASDKLSSCEGDLCAEVIQIKESFSKLFSR